MSAEPVRFKIAEPRTECEDHTVWNEGGALLFQGSKAECFRYVGKLLGRGVPEARR